MSALQAAANARYQAALALYGPNSSLPSLAFYGPLPSPPQIPASAYKGKHKPRTAK